ncbi:MAG: hypothetical protein ISR76_03570 [Planctomycetes bacterium]|nr:hypothetical protein [Planctomycetota bacterium]
MRILEVGFGRGLNTAVALARLEEADFQGGVEALGLEPFPQRLAPWPAVPGRLAGFAPWWGEPPGRWSLPRRPGWSGEVLTEAAPAGLPAGWGAHWMFLDLYSPGAHPEDWHPGLGHGLAAAAAPGAVLTSYCCARSLRDLLTGAGWRVERLRKGGQRDSLRAELPKQAPSFGAASA